MKEKLNYLNVGCGSKYHRDWVNVDIESNSPAVTSGNLLKGIPFPDETFEVLYHSQVLEHFPKEKAFSFMKECYRVLKTNGIIRVAVPDLENIVDEYKKYLIENSESPNKQAEEKYDWIMLEMFDQTVRNQGGGDMAKFLKQDTLLDEQYLFNRIGFVGRSTRNEKSSATHVVSNRIDINRIKWIIRKTPRFIKRKLANLLLGGKFKLGDFRLGGEIHMWMYDRFSLARLLNQVGFKDIRQTNAYESVIPDWNLYELDVKDGLAYDPTALFMEARK